MILCRVIEYYFLQRHRKYYDSYPVYKGNDLGLTYTSKESSFSESGRRLPKKHKLLFYNEGDGGEPI